jgi:hypothetical protein
MPNCHLSFADALRAASDFKEINPREARTLNDK